MMSDGGKGSNRRPGDDAAFSENYDAIFGSKKPEKGSFVWDKETKTFIPKSEYVSSESNAPYIMPDIQPYKSMATGEIVMGRRQHREHIKNHNLVEIGNETKYINQPKQLTSPAGLRETIARQVYQRS